MCLSDERLCPYDFNHESYLLIFFQTLRVLIKVDKSLVETHHIRLLQIDRSQYSAAEKDEASRRILEVIDILTQSDGEAYAHDIKTLIHSLQDGTSQVDAPLFQSIIEDVLTHVRIGQSDALQSSP